MLRVPCEGRAEPWVRAAAKCVTYRDGVGIDRALLQCFCCILCVFTLGKHLDVVASCLQLLQLLEPCDVPSRQAPASNFVRSRSASDQQPHTLGQLHAYAVQAML